MSKSSMKKSFVYKAVSIFSLTAMVCTGIFTGAGLQARASVLAGATAAMFRTDGMDFLSGDTPLSGVTLAMNNNLRSVAVDVLIPNAQMSMSEAVAVPESTPEPGVPEIPDAREGIDYGNTCVAQVTDYVNVRDAASEEGQILGKLYDDCVGTVLGQEGDWYHIKSGNVDGYVKAEFVVLGDRDTIDSVSFYRAKIKADALKVREANTTDCGVLDMAWNGESLDIVSDELYPTGWVEVKRGDTKGYVSADYVELAYEFDYAESKAEEEARLAEEARRADASNASIGSQVANYALQFVGNPYVWGGVSLTNGADCSGFVLSVYKHFGVSLPHSSYADRSVGRGVSTSEMRPGDLVCYSGHVALYIGNGQIVHAASRKSGIKVSNAFYRNILAVRRIF